jgi:5-oxoprolinase (ATP-hydrolysing)
MTAPRPSKQHTQQPSQKAVQPSSQQQDRWQFWIDRGGTFTDLVARAPNGQLVSHKLLSDNPEQYRDAALQGIRDILGIASDAPIPSKHISAVKMGTTVATNALLERKGEPTLLVINQGFRDALRIGYQNRPKLFEANIQLPELLYQQVIEVEERLRVDGEIITPLNLPHARDHLQQAYDDGFRSVAIVLMHGYRYHQHEQQLAKLSRDIGFTQVSTSHETSPLMKLVSPAYQFHHSRAKIRSYRVPLAVLWVLRIPAVWQALIALSPLIWGEPLPMSLIIAANTSAALRLRLPACACAHR